MSIHYANSIRLITNTANHATTIPTMQTAMLSALRCNLRNSLSSLLRELLALSELVLLPGIAGTYEERELTIGRQQEEMTALRIAE
jgi:hypothetical protein